MAPKKVKFIDLSIPIESVPSDPEFMIPQIEYTDHQGGLASAREILGCQPEDLPLGLGWAVERLILTSHSGTHLDAPWHYAPVSEGKRAKTIDQIPLEWCYADGVVLDFRGKPDGYGISAADVEQELKRIKYKIKPFDIVMIETGTDKHWGDSEYFLKGAGMTRESTLCLIEKGVKIMGTDAWGFDRPFFAIAEEFATTKNRKVIWAAHFTGIEREYLHIEKLANLDKLPPFGFKVACFPIKINRASAGWCRAVAILPD